MKRSLILIAMTLVFHEDCNAADPPVFEATYTCDGFKLAVSGRATRGTLAEVYPLNKKGVTGCDSLFTTANNAVTGLMNAPVAPITEDCGYSVVDVNANPKVRKVTVLFVEIDGVVQSTDMKAEFECAENAVSSVTKSVNFAMVTGDPTATFTPTKGFTFGFKILPGTTTAADAVSTNTLDTAVLNNKLIFAAYVDKALAVKEVKLHTCTMKPTGLGTPVTNVVKANGCPDTTSKLYKTQPDEQDKPTVASVTDNSKDYYVYVTAKFPVVKFTAAAGVDLACTVEGCLATGENRCALPPTCNGGTRRRRDLPQSSNNTFMVQRRIVILDRRDLAEFAENGHKRAQLSSCLSHVSFISVVAILAVLLVVSLAVSVFFCSKLIRQNNNNQQKEAYPNPGYKA